MPDRVRLEEQINIKFILMVAPEGIKPLGAFLEELGALAHLATVSGFMNVQDPRSCR